MDDHLMQDFLDVSWENVSQLETNLAALEQMPGDAELLAGVFRAMHSIKGLSGALGIGGLGRIAHALENVLGGIRGGALFTSATISLILESIDRIKDLLDGLEATGEEPDINISDLIHRLEQLLAAQTTTESVGPVASGWLGTGAAPVPSDHPGGDPKRSSPATRSAAAVDARGHASPHSVRMPVDLLDQLSRLVDELSATRNELLRLMDGKSPLAAPISQLDRITNELDAVAKTSRLQPIGDAFRPLPRLVRELACITGKPMELELCGGELELDRALLEAVRNSLTHLVRNAADHGIESPAERQSLGKPAVGRLVVAATREREQILLSIEDDGAGVNRQRVIQRAVDQGLIAEEQAALLSDADIVRLILQPGFTTAENATSVSGRGVGLDVVRTEIERIGGTLEISFVPGRGTKVRLAVPLSPASEANLPPRVLPLKAGDSPAAISVAHAFRALVIDDSMFFRQLLRAALEAEGYRVTLADAAERAIELLDRHNRFDVILCDIEMPGMDGCQFAAWRRTRPELRDIPLVAITSLDAEGHAERILSAGFDRLLVKFHPQQLRDTLAELIPRPDRSDARISA